MIKKKKKKPSEKKIDVNTRYPRRARRDFRGVLNDSIAKNWGICYYCYYYLFIGVLWDPPLRCDDFVCKFGFSLYCFIPAIASLC